MRFYVILLFLSSVTCIPVHERSVGNRPALDDFRIKQFFDTRTLSSFDDDKRKKEDVVDEESSSLEDINEDWDEAFNIDSRFPPYKARKVNKDKRNRSTQQKPLDIVTTKKTKAEPVISPYTVKAEITNANNNIEFIRRPKRDGVQNFSYPFNRELPPSINRYSSVTSRILNEYLDTTNDSK